MNFVLPIVGLLVGLSGGFAYHLIHSKKLVRSSEAKRAALMKEAEEEAARLRTEARSEVDELKSRKDEEVIIQTERVKRLDERIRAKEEHVRRRLQSAESKKQAVDTIESDLARIREEIAAARSREVAGLSQACGVPVEHAKETMLAQITEELEHDKLERLHRMDSFLEEDAEERAKSILLSVIQRYALPAMREGQSMIVDISDKKIRERLLGPNNENITKLQDLTGVECEIDEETEVLLIKEYDLLKRTIAKLAIDEAMKRRRITPEDIERAVTQVRTRAYSMMDELGRKTLDDLGIRNFDPRMTRIVGRLAYRTSFGQNVLSHSTEVAFFSGLLAGEVGGNIALCKRAGLIHDLGKGIDADVEGPHDLLSRDLGVKFNLDPVIIHAAYAHHEEVEYDIPEDRLVQVADAISASRPGARAEATEQYTERINAIEVLVNSFPGVAKAYAIQAGREVRVQVEPDEVSDEAAARLAKEIATAISQQLTFPGDIMVHVIRETTAIDYAR